MSSIIIKKIEIHILLVKGPFLRSGHIYVIRIYIFVTAMLWGKISRPAPRVSTLVPFISYVLPQSLTESNFKDDNE